MFICFSFLVMNGDWFAVNSSLFRRLVDFVLRLIRGMIGLLSVLALKHGMVHAIVFCDLNICFTGTCVCSPKLSGSAVCFDQMIWKTFACYENGSVFVFVNSSTPLFLSPAEGNALWVSNDAWGLQYLSPHVSWTRHSCSCGLSVDTEICWVSI